MFFVNKSAFFYKTPVSPDNVKNWLLVYNKAYLTWSAFGKIDNAIVEKVAFLKKLNESSFYDSI